ncbi:uncharacterized protein LOC131677214 [Topomyia yanbarensis]|uniref:uncharacterized protein LOC131677214 n=1 Tax=Topomyia yanbarensis TaxID=2498891 RepID=UPI00273B988D|nr:uncharacterized protein LOC131677214 [Topomyia yanbarensis]
MALVLGLLLLFGSQLIDTLPFDTACTHGGEAFRAGCNFYVHGSQPFIDSYCYALDQNFYGFTRNICCDGVCTCCFRFYQEYEYYWNAPLLPLRELTPEIHETLLEGFTILHTPSGE